MDWAEYVSKTLLSEYLFNFSSPYFISLLRKRNSKQNFNVKSRIICKRKMLDKVQQTTRNKKERGRESRDSQRESSRFLLRFSAVSKRPIKIKRSHSQLLEISRNGKSMKLIIPHLRRFLVRFFFSQPNIHIIKRTGQNRKFILFFEAGVGLVRQ